jgi:hypothetical protein
MPLPQHSQRLLNLDPVLWFFPYLAIYLVAAKASLPVAVLVWIFTGLHVIVLSALFWTAFKQRHELKKNTFLVLFFGAVFLLFLVPGAYLEYPSDPWEHFRRIFAWQNSASPLDNPLWYKFAYFFNYSLLQFLPVEARRIGLDWASAFWQLLLAWQFFRLAMALCFSRTIAALQVLGVFALFGHNLFSLRYYALSSMPLAFAAFLSCAIYLTKLRSGTERLHVVSLAKLGIFFLLMLFNHIQELLLTGVFAVGVWAEYRGWLEKRKAILFATFLTLWIASYTLLRQPDLLAWVHQGFVSARAYDPFLGGWLSKWGVFRLWRVSGHYFQTYGVHGVASLVLAGGLYRQHPRIAALTLTPVALMLFPPFVIALALVTELPNSYRVLYAFPTSFMLVTASYSLFHRHWGRRTACAAVVSLLLGLGLLADSPWRGRLRFQLARTSSLEDLRFIEPLATWLKHSGPRLKTGCNVFSDNLTGFLLATHLGTGFSGVRTYPGSILSQTDDAGHFWQFIATYKACLVVFYDLALLPPSFTSPITQSSGHWTNSSQNIAMQIHPNYAQFEALLQTDEWQRWNAPPFYRIYIQKHCHYSENSCL